MAMTRSSQAHDLSQGLDDWTSFKRRFVSDDGRVLDTGNKDISHSEGQGWGLFAAVFFQDVATFDRLLSWTTRKLRRPHDALHVWRYTPGAQNPVQDSNNATDGDLFIAVALARAAAQWNRPELKSRAQAIARDILRLLVRQLGTRTVLLPGASGFESRNGVTLNPSYYVFPFFAELSRLVPSPLWHRLQRDGLELLSTGRYGQWMLPPDWIAVSTKGDVLAPAQGWPPRFSYDAIRIPLFLSWSRLDLPPLADAFGRYWNSFVQPPAWVDLTTGQVASYIAPRGMRDVAAFANIQQSPNLDRYTVDDAEDYYSAGLILLTQIARKEIGSS